MSVKPFSPDEALANKVTIIPDAVFETVNTLLSKHYTPTGCTITVDEVVNILEGIGFHRPSIFTNKWLDFEKHYMEHGWHVDFNKRLYYEDGSDFWVFKPKT